MRETGREAERQRGREDERERERAARHFRLELYFRVGEGDRARAREGNREKGRQGDRAGGREEDTETKMDRGRGRVQLGTLNWSSISG